MSLPQPTVGGSRNGNTFERSQQMNANMAMDAPLIALAQQCNGDLRLLFHSFFSFLHRRTDFYCIRHPLDESVETDVGQSKKTKKAMGFKDGDAEKLLIAAFRQFPLRRMPPMEELVKRKQEDDQKKKQETVEKDTHFNGTKQKTNDTEDNTQETEDGPSISQGTGPTNDSVCETNTETPVKSKPSKDESLVRYTDGGKQIPVGNGGSSTGDYKYKWTQTLHEITIAMSLQKPATRAKELSVDIQMNSVFIKYRPTNSVLLEGKLPDLIDKEESTWSIESNVILLQFEKKTKTWWEKALVEEIDEIDLDLVDKKHKISNYDEVTQGMIRKLLFDERQEKLGLPKSDEILQETVGNPSTKTDGTKNNESGNIITSVEELKKIPGVEFFDKHNFPK